MVKNKVINRLKYALGVAVAGATSICTTPATTFGNALAKAKRAPIEIIVAIPIGRNKQ